MAGDYSGAAVPRHFAFSDWKAIGKRVKGDISHDNLSIVSAGVAFYAFFALFPALSALVALYGLVANPSDVERLVQQFQGVLPQEVSGIITDQLNKLVRSGSSQLGFGALVGLLVALWSTNKGTKSLMTALNIAYNESEDRGFIRLNAVGLSLTLAGIVGVVLAVALIAVVPSLLEGLGVPGAIVTAVNWLRWPLLALMMIGGLGLFYRYGPSRRPPNWRWWSYGSVVATLLWLVVSGLFSWYASSFGSYNETFGSMAAIAILLMWFFLSAFAVLLGAELNSEMEYQTAEDTTAGEPRPKGRRGARQADSASGDEERFRA